MKSLSTELPFQQSPLQLYHCHFFHYHSAYHAYHYDFTDYSSTLKSIIQPPNFLGFTPTFLSTLATLPPSTSPPTAHYLLNHHLPTNTHLTIYSTIISLHTHPSSSIHPSPPSYQISHRGCCGYYLEHSLDHRSCYLHQWDSLPQKVRTKNAQLFFKRRFSIIIQNSLELNFF